MLNRDAIWYTRGTNLRLGIESSKHKILRLLSNEETLKWIPNEDEDEDDDDEEEEEEDKGEANKHKEK